MEGFNHMKPLYLNIPPRIKPFLFSHRCWWNNPRTKDTEVILLYRHGMTELIGWGVAGIQLCIYSIPEDLPNFFPNFFAWSIS